MTFAEPLGLWALAGVPLLLGLYFLRRRSAPRVVSATFLWRATDDAVQAGPRLRALQKEVSLVLEIAAVLAAAAFLGDLRCASEDEGAVHTIVVLDSSLSMRARHVSGETSAEAARQAARGFAHEGVVSLIASGPRPTLIAGPAARQDVALAALDAWEPGAAAHGPEASFALARELAGGAARIVWITDRKEGHAIAEDVDVLAVGEAGSNAGFTAASRSDDERTRLKLRVAGFGSKAITVPLEIIDENRQILDRRTLTLEPATSVLVELALAPTGPLTARLATTDALPDDDVITLAKVTPPTLSVRVAFTPDSPEGSALRRALAGASGVNLSDQESLRFVAPGAPATPWTVFVGASAADLRTVVGPFFADRRGPLFEDVVFDGVTWTCGSNPPGRALLTAGERVLVSEEPGPVFHLNVDLSRSNLARSTAWPVLVGNLLALRREALPGFDRRTAQLGEEVRFTLDPPGPWSLTGPGLTRSVGLGTQAFVPVRAGDYVLAGPSGEAARVTVLALDAIESDLRALGSGSRDSDRIALKPGESAPERSSIPIVVFALLLLADWIFAAPGLRRAQGVRP